jgi:hypothetical protein
VHTDGTTDEYFVNHTYNLKVKIGWFVASSTYKSNRSSGKHKSKPAIFIAKTRN